MLNINNSTDPNFRYKMNNIDITLTGCGNGCFTYLNNLEIIAVQINNNPKTIIKYIGFCLGSKINDEKYWVQGHHKNDKIQEIIFHFIKVFVLCTKCSIPELVYNIEKNNKKDTIKTHCSGCGFDHIIIGITLNKNNKKIFDKLLNDIKKGFFKYQNHTTKIENKHLDISNTIVQDNDIDFF